MAKVISDFSGEHAFLSNFFPSLIRIPNNSHEYRTVEHFYQANKFSAFTKHHVAVQEAEAAKEAKKLGQRGPIRSDWEEVKIGIMLAGLRYKFRMHVHLMRRLLETEDAILVEGNDWGDTFWGCVKVQHPTIDLNQRWTGLNMLGTLLMIVRQEIKTSHIPNSGFKAPVLKGF